MQIQNFLEAPVFTKPEHEMNPTVLLSRQFTVEMNTYDAFFKKHIEKLFTTLSDIRPFQQHNSV